MDYLRNRATRSGVYRIHGNDGQSYQVYCDLTSEPGSAWTLVMSYTYKNVALAPVRYSMLSANSPLNAKWPRWDAYRLELTQVEQLKSVSSHWRFTCNFPTERFQYWNYMRAKFAEFDAINFTGRKICKKVEYINVRGHDCNRCTAVWWQSPKILHHDSAANVCDLGSSCGYVKSEDSFGSYTAANSEFRCTSVFTSSTNLWFGGYLDSL